MSELSLHSNQLARGIATTILQGFNRHFEIFQRITVDAIKRFEAADWQAVQLASRERIVLYDRRIAETVAMVRDLYEVKTLDLKLWQEVKHCYIRMLLDHQQPELAETFYNSVFCRQFPRQYYTNHFIFLRSSISTEYIDSEEASYIAYYPVSSDCGKALRRFWRMRALRCL
ncbi:isocitrate dehydrogenase kinase/phosphatase AceK regulatory subunit [Candidatus Thiothrix anitrata]|uniref:isocitrate dehydrogenase kinase/phosphatase AceK regulatory subunit n=1 Tax=Candidatus Thiothrix anitrata TaxID=2823902 RepID=UPI00224BA668